MSEPDFPKGFNCSWCGKYNAFDGYVMAHVRMVLVHECECGARHSIVMCHATRRRKGKKSMQKPECLK